MLNYTIVRIMYIMLILDKLKILILKGIKCLNFSAF